MPKSSSRSWVTYQGFLKVAPECHEHDNGPRVSNREDTADRSSFGRKRPSRSSDRLLELIVLEATGGCESRAVKALSEAGFAVTVVNPIRVWRFAEGLGILAKTDKIDAQVIAHFASVLRPPFNGRQTPLEEQMAAFVERRGPLLVELVAEKNRLSTCPECVREVFEAHIAWQAACRRAVLRGAKT
jgi:transposase